MLWSLWVTRNERIFRDAMGHTGMVLRYMAMGMTDLGVFKNPIRMTLDHSLETKQLVQPLGFHYVNLG